NWGVVLGDRTGNRFLEISDAGGRPGAAGHHLADRRQDRVSRPALVAPALHPHRCAGPTRVIAIDADGCKNLVSEREGFRRDQPLPYTSVLRARVRVRVAWRLLKHC